jgi:transposase-like protein
MSPRLHPDVRRAVVLEVLRPQSSITHIARRYGISRQRGYQLLEAALHDPKGKLKEAEKEAEFRRRVLELSG